MGWKEKARFTLITTINLLLLVSYSGSVSSEIPSVNIPRLHLDGQYFKDDGGRTVILRGVNISGSSKVPGDQAQPFQPLNKEEYLDPLSKYGVNVIRLTFNWEAFEGERGVYNHNYLEYIQKIITWAEKRGIYIIVDFHQDGYSRYAMNGCGEGFPKWAVPEHLQRVPRNDKNCEKWFLMLASKENNQAFNSFYQGGGGVKDAFIKMAQHLVSKFKNSPNVIGYDIINEPWGEQEKIFAFYEEAASAIREKDPNAILFLSPHGASSTGFVKLGIRKPSFDNYVFAPHFYDVTINYPLWRWMGVNSKHFLKRIKKYSGCPAETPLFIGEFGVPITTKWATEYINNVYNALDSMLMGGAQWDYGPGTEPEWNGEGWFTIVDKVIEINGEDKKEKMVLRNNFQPRPYFRKISGNPLEAFSNIKDVNQDYDIFLKWQHQPKLGGTEIFIPDLKENYKYFQIESEIKGNVAQIDFKPDFENNLLVCDSPHESIISVTLKKRNKE